MHIPIAVRWSALFTLVVLAPTACGDESPTDPPDGRGEPAILALSDSSLAFAALGDSTRLDAAVRDEDGTEITDATVAWSSTDTAVATVSDAGWVVAVAEGSADVVASSGELADTAEVLVEQAGAGVEASPDSTTLHAVEDSAQLTAVVRDANGSEIPDAAVVWTSGDTTVATVSDAGWIVARGNGAAEVVASVDERADTVAVEVEQVAVAVEVSPADTTLGQDETVQLDAAVEDANGFAIEGAAVEWTSADAAVATVDGAGSVTAVRAGGKTEITATAADATDGAKLTVLDQLIFEKGGGGATEVYLMNADGSGATGLTGAGAFNGTHVWSADGSTIAFESSRDGNFEIYVMNADGSGATRLTDDGSFDIDPDLLPDGSGVVFESDRDGNQELYRVGVDGSAPIRLTNEPASDRDPTVSPDGSRIAFESDRDGNLEIYVMDADGSGQTNLTNYPAGNDGPPVWSPDGSQILFESNRDGNSEIYVMDADGSGQTNLTNHPADDFEPAWSPDGSRILFETTRDGGREVYTMKADGSAPVNLTNDGGDDAGGVWSPDGSQILFESNRSGDYELYLVNVDGTGLIRLTEAATSDRAAAWRPRP